MADQIFVNGKAKNFLKTKIKASKSKMRKSLRRRVENEDPSDATYVSTNPNKPLDAIKRKKKNMKKGKKTSKMGSPVIIVEDVAKECQPIRIPPALRHTKVERSAAMVSHSLDSFGLVEKNKKRMKVKKAQITIVECINPSPMEDICNRDAEIPKKDIQASTEEKIEEETLELEINDSNEIPNKNDKRFNPNVEKMDYEEQFSDSEVVDTMNEISVAEKKSLFLSETSNFEETEKRLPRFYSMRNKVLAIIEPDSRFYFHGKLRLKVFYGAVRVYGASFSSTKSEKPIEIYSPRAYSPIAIEAIESEIEDKRVDNLLESLIEQSADQKFAKRLKNDIENLEDRWAVVELENFDNQLTNFLSSYCPHHLFPRIEDPSNLSWRDSRRAEMILQANLRFPDNCKQLYIGSRGIDDFADCICYDWETNCVSRTVIAGGKSVGKSTTARYLVNKLLAKSKAVLVLDLDPGQAEFTIAGCISLNVVEEPLLGPNFTHLKTPYYQLYVGSPDVTRCFTQYLDGIKKIVDRIFEDPKLVRLPLVINTMGFCKGIGLDIISYVIKLISPTDVVQILSRRSKNNFDDTLSRQVIDRQSLGWMTWMKDTINRDKPAKHRLHVIYSEAETGSGTAESWNLEAHQQREVVLLAYLSKILQNETSKFGGLQKSSMLSINAVAPYVVPFSAVSVSLAGAFIPQVLSVMNGNIVALCGVDPETESMDESNIHENSVVTYPRVLVRPPLSTCYGFGILRGIDMEKEQIFINTPLTPNVMQFVNCLIGCVNLPLSLLHLSQPGAPYTGSEYDLPTSRGSRRGYYRMRYQAQS